METKHIKLLMSWISVGLHVLSARLVLLLVLAMTFSLFCWCMYWPTYERIGCVTIFAILVFLPIIKMDGKQATDRAIVNPQEKENE